MKSHFKIQIELEHLVFCLFFAAFFLFHDHMGNDFYWHLKAGEYIYLNQALPSTDPFSFTHNHTAWTLHEWLFELLLYMVHTHFGIYGVQLLISLLLSLATFIVFRAAASLNKNKYLCLFISAVTFILISNFGLPRPQLFTYLFLAIYIYILIGYKYKNYEVNILWLPLIMVLWVNLHAGYAIGLFVLVMYLIGEFIDQKLTSSGNTNAEVQLGPLAVITVACIFSSLINPNFYHIWIYPFDVMSMSANNDINEWASPDFHRPNYKLYLIYIFSFFFVKNQALRYTGFTENILVFSLLIISFTSLRHIPVALLVIAPFYAMALKDFKMHVKFPNAITDTFNHITKNFTTRKQIAGANFAAPALLSIFVVATFALHSITDKRLEYSEYYKFPVNAVKFIQDNNIMGNVLNEYGAGGYLIYSLYPDSKVFIDGRADLYGDEHFYKHLSIIETRRGWKEYFDEYNFDYILCRNYSMIVWPLSQMHEYKLIYRDARHSIYLRNIDKYKPLFDKYHTSYISRSLMFPVNSNM